MYDGKKHWHKTEVNGQDGYDELEEVPNGKRFFKIETWDDRVLELHKPHQKVKLKAEFDNLYAEFAPLHKQLNLANGMLSESEELDVKRVLRLLANEYLMRKQAIDSATDCDQIDAATWEGYGKLLTRLRG